MTSTLELAKQHDETCAIAGRGANRRQSFGTPGKYPCEITGLSVLPEQAREFEDHARGAGLTGVSFDRRGRCHVDSPGQYKQYRRLRGVHFNNAYDD
jgi:hypothetical protein